VTLEDSAGDSDGVVLFSDLDVFHDAAHCFYEFGMVLRDRQSNKAKDFIPLLDGY